MTQPLDHFRPGADGPDATVDVSGPRGVPVRVPYWDDRIEAEGTARLIADAVNADTG